MADAVNVMCFSKTSADASQWEIFASKDLPELRTFVHKLNQEKERNFGLDPILSESTYLDDGDLIDLERERLILSRSVSNRSQEMLCLCRLDAPIRFKTSPDQSSVLMIS
jgi:hypothetical protein